MITLAMRRILTPIMQASHGQHPNEEVDEGQEKMKGQGSVQGKPSLHLQVQWLHACEWLELQGE